MSESLRRSAHLRCAGELTVALARRFDSERVGEAGAAEEDAEETKEEDWQDGSEEKDGRGRCRRRLVSRVGAYSRPAHRHDARWMAVWFVHAHIQGLAEHTLRL